MTLSAESWLMLLALAMYAWDSAMLLDADELVLVQRWRGGWRPAFGANGWKLAGREPFMPNLLAPWCGVVRIRWRLDDVAAPPVPATAADALPKVGAAPRIAVTALLLLVFVALPACLFVFPVLAALLPVVAAIYATCLVALLGLRRERAALGLSAAAYRKLFWECITCPPFGINAVRKACLAAPVRATLADVDAADDRETVRRQVALRLRERIEVEPEGSARTARLQAALRLLERDLASREPS